jgi:hypothetical protein
MREIADNYWWCSNCHEEIDARNVTHQECHDACGHRVKWIENILGDMSDGYHTFDELYEQRAVLFSALCRLFSDGAWKSKLHSDGTMFDGHFIVGIETPDGQYTYHYGLDKWDWFPVRILDNAPEWDGHTDKDVRRLWSLAPPAQAAKEAEKK